MKIIKTFFVTFLIAFLLSSCMSLNHVVGTGASSGVIIEKKQWYVLWGLVPINELNTKAMAEGASNYTINSKVKFIDYVISAFTSTVSVNVQTVTVQK